MHEYMAQKLFTLQNDAERRGMIGQKMTSFKTIFLPKIPRILFFCTDILMTFVTEKNYYLNPQSYRVSMLQKLRTVTEIQLGELFTDIQYVAFLSLIFT